jgi:Zn-dependent protease with chaperone function
MTLVSDEPNIYASPQARALLDPDQFRTIVAHELGHSWSTHYVNYQVVDWIRRLLFIPLLTSTVTVLLSKIPTVAGQTSTFLLLTALVLIWHLNNWMSTILGRPQELAADLYGVEVTRTPTAFVEAMAKLAEVEPYNVFPNLFDTLALCSHPCTVKRLKHVVAALSNPSRQGDRERVRGSRSD